MNVSELQPGETRIRHWDGPEGTYIGWKKPDGGPLWLIVRDAAEAEHVWHVDDCEVIR